MSENFSLDSSDIIPKSFVTLQTERLQIKLINT